MQQNIWQGRSGSGVQHVRIKQVVFWIFNYNKTDALASLHTIHISYVFYMSCRLQVLPSALETIKPMYCLEITILGTLISKFVSYCKRLLTLQPN